MLWVLASSFEYPQYIFELMGKFIITISGPIYVYDEFRT